ncbi:MAG: YkgJ family cysteine cluster protein [Halobacteriota archaeon]
MRVDCAGCAGCCVDWRTLGPVTEHERDGSHRPLDDVYNLVPLSRDDVHALLDAGLADATTPRLWTADEGPSVTVDGHDIAAIDGKPVFFLGLRKVPKPVAPFETDPQWLPTCVFLDPATLQCRVHDAETYPEECAAYPGSNLALGAETECERVEDAMGGERLLDRTPPSDADGPLVGPQAVGQKVFVYPEVDALTGVVDRAVRQALTAEDRARFVAAAAAGSPGTTEIDETHYETALERARAADSWAGRAIASWRDRAETADPDPELGRAIEGERGAPPTPGW